jgi:hypothetical protein
MATRFIVEKGLKMGDLQPLVKLDLLAFDLMISG